MSGKAGDEEQPERPSALWRAASRVTTTAVGSLARSFLNVFCEVEVFGLEEFQRLLDSRWDVQGRERGLVTGMLGSIRNGSKTILMLDDSLQSYQRVRTP